MRCMTSNAAFGLNRSMFINKGTLLVCVTLEAGRVDAGRESRLFEFKTAVRIVAVAALHSAFQHLVMERQLKLMLGLAVTSQTELRFARFQQTQIRETRFLRV